MPEKTSRKARKTVRQQKNSLPLVLLGLGGLLLITLAVVFLTRPPAATTPASDTRSVPRVGLEEALQAYEKGEAVFLDVRSAESFNLLRISGAVNIPENELLTRLSELDKNNWIIPYCT
ncbi:MAG: hypothetical protein Fur0016_23830 [Anaerolineales bacterium]